MNEVCIQCTGIMPSPRCEIRKVNNTQSMLLFVLFFFKEDRKYILIYELVCVQNSSVKILHAHIAY